MSTLTIRNIEPAIKDTLRLVAAANGRSMEEEVRSILRNALAREASQGGLGSRMHVRLSALGGVELDLPDRRESARAASVEGGDAA
ncbi:MAG: Arc family DNA-binding protein [Burkholderiales bacterium]|nr:Arc family DNA-binding protein [Burkholderiales bacterium]